MVAKISMRSDDDIHDAVLRSYHIPYELRDCADDAIEYNALLPIDQPPDAISIELQKLESIPPASYTWKRKQAA
jgi:hypothetical protein